MLDAERRLDLLFQTHGIDIYRREDVKKRMAELGQEITEEHKKSVHGWDEITIAYRYWAKAFSAIASYISRATEKERGVRALGISFC